jgi:hypothetical protein
VLAGVPAAEAARVCDFTLENLPADGAEPAYEVWRSRVQAHLKEQQPAPITES